MKNILVPTDFGETSKNAISFAAEIAKHINAKIHLLHSFHIPVTTVESGAILLENELNILEKANTTSLNNLISDLKTHFPSTEFVGIQNEGFLIDCIKELTETTEFEYLVMGTQGDEGMSKLLFGSNTASIVGEISVPILVVPDTTSYSEIKKIAYATDFSAADFQTIKKTIQFAQLFNAELIILHSASADSKHFSSEQNEFQKMVLDYSKLIDNQNISFEFLIQDNFENQITDYALENEVDLIVLVTKKRNFIEKLFHHSHTKNLTMKTSTPLLVYNS